MQIAICDDVLEHRKSCAGLLEKCLRKYEIEAELKEYVSGQDLLYDMEEGRVQIDLVYLDISMPGEDGIVVGGKIRELEYNCEIIFYTMKEDYWSEAFDLEALHYIVKDKLDEMKFEKIFLMANKAVERNTEESIVLSFAGESRIVKLAEIRYFEVYQHVVTVHYGKSSTFEFYTPLGKLEELLFDKGFVRCHKSYLVSSSYIESISSNKVLMKNGDEIPLGRAYKNSVKQELFER